MMETNRRMIWKKCSRGNVEAWDLYLNIKHDNLFSFIFENTGNGRYSYVSCTNREILRIEKDEKEDPMEMIRKWLINEEYKNLKGVPENFPEWTGGAAGYFSYDFIRFYESIPLHAEDDLGLPYVYMMKVEEVFAFDMYENQVYFIVNYGEGCKIKNSEEANWRVLEMEQVLKGCTPGIPRSNSYLHKKGNEEFSFSLNQHEFKEAVRKIREYIAAGDVFQVNLSLRQNRTTFLTDEEIYHELRLLNPSPYMGLFHFPEFQLISASPELLLRVKDGKVSTRPIAGTRKRGQNEQEDLELELELIETEKENAEHIMLVDLERNDLGKVCEFGSVKVDEWMVIEKYSHVMHLVSNVVGQLREGFDGLDALMGVFPGGTITGAPKIRTMEIIEELEPLTRGPYTGSMGLLGFDGSGIFNIIIRTLILQKNMAYVQAGAGIVIDSVPKAEYYESLKKAEALWRAVSLGEEKLSLVEREESLE
ncbi:MAG TPA: aminodeoxychorismate synthase component I [Paenibacillaceae bacterium]|nr:aminodeoxychorismate synthase component I [Paenibacillaceae bacterium]